MYRQFGWFALAGVVGFVVDVGVLYVGLYLGAGYYIGRFISFLAAVFTTWQINRRHAFAHVRGEGLMHEWVRYLTAMLGGGLVNYAIYTLIILSLPHAPLVPLLAVGAGAIFGLGVNFLSAKFWVFKRRQA